MIIRALNRAFANVLAASGPTRSSTGQSILSFTLSVCTSTLEGAQKRHASSNPQTKLRSPSKFKNQRSETKFTKQLSQSKFAKKPKKTELSRDYEKSFNPIEITPKDEVFVQRTFEVAEKKAYLRMATLTIFGKPEPAIFMGTYPHQEAVRAKLKARSPIKPPTLGVGRAYSCEQPMPNITNSIRLINAMFSRKKHQENADIRLSYCAVLLPETARSLVDAIDQLLLAKERDLLPPLESYSLEYHGYELLVPSTKESKCVSCKLLVRRQKTSNRKKAIPELVHWRMDDLPQFRDLLNEALIEYDREKEHGIVNTLYSRWHYR